MLNQVMETVIQLTQAERGYIVLKNPHTGELEFKVARGLSAEETAAGGRIVSWSVINLVVESGEPLLTVDAGADEQFSHSESIAGFNLLSILAVPLKARDEVIGVAYCDNRVMAGLFKENELGLLTSFGQQAAVAIENARLFEDIRAQMALIEEMQVRLSNIFASIGSGVITINDEDCIIVCNEAAEEITGASNDEVDCNGVSLHEVLPHVTEGFFEYIETGAARAARSISGPSALSFTGGRPIGKWWPALCAATTGCQPRRCAGDRRSDRAQGAGRTAPPAGHLHSRGAAGRISARSANWIPARPSIRFRPCLPMCAALPPSARPAAGRPDAHRQSLSGRSQRRHHRARWHRRSVPGAMPLPPCGIRSSTIRQDHALRALRAALRHSVDVQALHDVLHVDHQLHFGIGIHTGHSVLGMVGGANRIEFAALGEAPDVSKFLQENAEPGEIIISAETYRPGQRSFRSRCDRGAQAGGRLTKAYGRFIASACPRIARPASRR